MLTRYVAVSSVIKLRNLKTEDGSRLMKVLQPCYGVRSFGKCFEVMLLRLEYGDSHLAHRNDLQLVKVREESSPSNDQLR